MNQLENINIAEYLDSSDSVETITNLLLQNSVSLVKKNCKRNKNNTSFVRLPEEVKVSRYCGKIAFDDWKHLISHLRVMLTTCTVNVKIIVRNFEIF